ncbi:pyridoxal 5'-phosphate synthase glutaminase subunit PdxT [Rothia sp. CCM 9419]|uniref:pyridoxal 5'-phosphate synthase glutaminase subunit PdxT n=1 Tax=Rothia sp. CCM 9419 TaxID=3402662 RepID=UPI003AEE9F48
MTTIVNNSGNSKTVGVLALQGGVAEHAQMMESLGAQVVLVKKAEHLHGLDALILPGGESSTIDRLTRIFGVRDALREAIISGVPTLGTCAGIIMLAHTVDDPAPGQQTLDILDISVDRNAFGSQVDSAETEVLWRGADEQLHPVHAAFIRAPRVSRVGQDVQVTAHHGGQVVGVRQGNVMGISFHPELTGDTTIHRELLSMTNFRSSFCSLS